MFGMFCDGSPAAAHAKCPTENAERRWFPFMGMLEDVGNSFRV